jgi:hypothetical protein
VAQRGSTATAGAGRCRLAVPWHRGRAVAGDACLDGLLEAIDRVPLAVELLVCNGQGDPDLTVLSRRWTPSAAGSLPARAGQPGN